MPLPAYRPDASLASLASNIAARRIELVAAARQMVRPDQVEDLAQTTIERALKNMNKFQPNSNLRAWLRRIMSNLVVDSWRQDRHLRSWSLDGCDVEASVSEPEAPWEDLSAADIRQAVVQLLPIFREVFELFSHGLSYRQISRRLGISEGTVGSRLLRGRAHLRILLAPAVERRAVALTGGAEVTALPVKRGQPPVAEAHTVDPWVGGIGEGVAAVACGRR